MSGMNYPPDPNQIIPDGRGHTALHRAIQERNKPLIFGYIALNKFDYTQQDALNHTVLWMAASEMVDPEVVAALVMAGANINDPLRAEIQSFLNRASKDAKKTQAANTIKAMLRM